ncbi:MAG: DUF4430 domain-containing protein [Longibaculum sp.]
MNKTKKLTIIFVILCFVGIGVIGVYNAIKSDTPVKQDKREKVTEIVKETETKTTEKKDSTKPKTEKTEKKQSTQQTDKKETKKTQPKQDNQTSQTPKEEPKKDIPQTKVTISITGIDSIIGQGSVIIKDGMSVYDVLNNFAKEKGITLKTSGFGQIIYIQGINGLNEFDHGPQSGWLYKVNGVQPNAGAGRYNVKDGDHIEWIYSTSKS